MVEITSQKLSDGSQVYGVKFTATDTLGAPRTVEIACVNLQNATSLLYELQAGMSYADIQDA